MRELAVAIRASPNRLSAFRDTLIRLKIECCEKEYVGEEEIGHLHGNGEESEESDKIIKVLLPLRDVPTRWSSTFLMLRRAVAIRQGLDETTYHRDFMHQDIGTKGWERIEECVTFLKSFADVTQEVEGFKQPTLSSVIPLYNKLLDCMEDWSTNDKHSLSSQEAALAAFRKLSKYYDMTTAVYLVSTVLDPRLKIHYFVKHGWENGAESYGGGNLIEKNVRPA